MFTNVKPITENEYSAYNLFQLTSEIGKFISNDLMAIIDFEIVCTNIPLEKNYWKKII